ncbi:unnamed protein product [Symbiodinium necroappetens]|uniref:Uncharacterized protein n=1 Tax=Symbiodinium necroappetens TaxID=1628268 RepID=A0A813AQJ3_9DINO|nr:unnamed protein product [Symbiodinium necroappetens]
MEDGEGAAELLGALCRCRELEDVGLCYCEKIPESAWAALGEGMWPVLRTSRGIPEKHLSRVRGGHLPSAGPSSSASVAVWLSEEVLRAAFSRNIPCRYRGLAC